MKKSDITTIIITKNEGNNIDSVLKSVAFCKHIIIIDDFSTDKTVEIAKKYKASVFRRRLNNDFAAQRNFGLQNAKTEWVLFLDADEIVSNDLAVEIQNAINRPFNGYYIPRKDVLLTRKLKYGEWSQNKFLRLARKRDSRWVRPVHERWNVPQPVGYLKNSIEHYPHKTLDQLIDSINFYTHIHGIENLNKHEKIRFYRVLFYPLIKFLQNFIYKKGFKDGVHGFVYSGFMSFHSFLGWSTAYLKQ